MEASVATVPRLLAGASVQSTSLEEHVVAHGPMPEAGGHAAAAVLEEVSASGLRGRGGAAFPTATKMTAVAEAGRASVVVANAAEGEPASAKDRSLLEWSPHLVLDGALLAAQVVGAGSVIVCVRESSGEAHASLSRALAERKAARMLPVPAQVVATPNAYLAGEESALVNFLNGGPAKPTFVPPRPFERGVAKRPTLVQNVETLAHLALIARHGADWFRQAGTPTEPGTTLVTLAGAVAEPGVYEIELGTPLRDLFAAAGGTTEALRAVLLGGYFGSWLEGRTVDELVLHEEHLRPLGGGLGAGVIVALPGSSCPVAETARVSAYMAREAAGQCGPCTHGLGAIAEGLATLVRGRAEPNIDEKLARWSAIVPKRGACHHPDGAIRFVSSALNVFADEFLDHRQRGPCAACGDAPQLPVPGLQSRRRPR